MRFGFGQCKYEDDSFYEGYWLNDQKHGPGRFFHPNGTFKKCIYFSDLEITEIKASLK